MDSLVNKLREARVERVIAPILSGGSMVGDRLDDDLSYVEDLGLIDRTSGYVEMPGNSGSSIA